MDMLVFAFVRYNKVTISLWIISISKPECHESKPLKGTNSNIDVKSSKSRNTVTEYCDLEFSRPVHSLADLHMPRLHMLRWKSMSDDHNVRQIIHGYTVLCHLHSEINFITSTWLHTLPPNQALLWDSILSITKGLSWSERRTPCATHCANPQHLMAYIQGCRSSGC